MRLQLTPLAERDLDNIAAYIAADNPRRAAGFVRELRQKCREVARNPRGYQLRQELGEGIRLCAYGSYLIVFKAVEDVTLVVRVLHGARDVPTVLRSV